MKTIVGGALLMVASSIPVVAFAAADVRDPVREVIEVTAQNWRLDDPESEDVFAPQRLKRLFSADFVRAYEEASQHPAYDPPEGETTGSPFDYDPIAGGQDGCPLEDIRIEDEGDGQVTALFKNRRCFGDEAEYQEDTVLIFHVVTENGRPVIDDMYRVENHETSSSLKDDLEAIAEQ